MNLQFLILTLTLVGSSYCAVAKENILELSNPAPIDNKPLLNTDTTTVAPPSSSTTVAPTKSTTVAPTTSTTVAPTTSTTVAPTTSTTVAPTTSTTVAPTTSTTIAPTTSSTAAPTTTTTAASVTTQAPPNTTTTVAPPPTPKAGEWFVKENNVTCIVAKMIVFLNISYPGKNKTEFAAMTIDGNGNETEAKGTCGNSSQTLQIAFGDGNSAVLNFDVNTTSSRFDISNIQVTVNVSALPNAKENVSMLVYSEDKPLFSTPLAMSYKCNKLQAVNLTNPSTNLTAAFSVGQTQIQAFRKDAEVKFGDAQDCEPIDTPDMVPIAVGISLAVMILVVLVAYLIGRRRVTTNGYVSM